MTFRWTEPVGDPEKINYLTHFQMPKTLDIVLGVVSFTEVCRFIILGNHNGDDTQFFNICTLAMSSGAKLTKF